MAGDLLARILFPLPLKIGNLEREGDRVYRLQDGILFRATTDQAIATD